MRYNFFFDFGFAFVAETFVAPASFVTGGTLLCEKAETQKNVSRDAVRKLTFFITAKM